MSEMRLIFVANSPSPNTVELYNALHRRHDTEVSVAYLSRRNAKWQNPSFPTDHDILESRNLSPFPSRVNTAFCPGLLLRLLFKERRARIIIQGYSNPTNFLLILAMSFLRPGADWAFWGERIKKSPRSHPIRFLVKRAVISAISRSRRVYAVGQAGVKSYAEHGVPERLLRSLPYTKDFSVYQSPETTHDNEVIVTTARLVPSKKIDQLVRVFSDLADDYPDWRLNIIGDGAMRPELENGIKENLRGRITFHGYAGSEKQSEIYAGADLFVLPSMHDGWGMVVPEAMAAGLPVITTDGVMAGRDLVRSGENGFLLPPGQSEPLKAILLRVMRGDLDLEKMGAAALDSVSAYYPEHVSEDLVADISTGWRGRE